MLHQSRRWCITDCDDSAEALASDLARTTWVLCNGYRWRGLLVLNDSTCEDAAQEYAVIDENSGYQIESLTVSWMKTEDLISTLNEIAARRWPITMQRTWPAGKDPRQRLEPPAIHRRCALCA